MVAHSTCCYLYYFWSTNCLLIIFCSQSIRIYDILVNMKLFFAKTKATLKKIQIKIFEIFNLIASLAFYFLGVGPTKIVSLLFRKQFLQKSFSSSAWRKVNKVNLEKQY